MLTPINEYNHCNPTAYQAATKLTLRKVLRNYNSVIEILLNYVPIGYLSAKCSTKLQGMLKEGDFESATVQFQRMLMWDDTTMSYISELHITNIL